MNLIMILFILILHQFALQCHGQWYSDSSTYEPTTNITSPRLHDHLEVNLIKPYTINVSWAEYSQDTVGYRIAVYNYTRECLLVKSVNLLLYSHRGTRRYNQRSIFNKVKAVRNLNGSLEYLKKLIKKHFKGKTVRVKVITIKSTAHPICPERIPEIEFLSKLPYGSMYELKLTSSHFSFYGGHRVEIQHVTSNGFGEVVYRDINWFTSDYMTTTHIMTPSTDHLFLQALAPKFKKLESVFLESDWTITLNPIDHRSYEVDKYLIMLENIVTHHCEEWIININNSDSGMYGQSINRCSHNSHNITYAKTGMDRLLSVTTSILGTAGPSASYRLTAQAVNAWGYGLILTHYLSDQQHKPDPLPVKILESSKYLFIEILKPNSTNGKVDQLLVKMALNQSDECVLWNIVVQPDSTESRRDREITGCAESIIMILESSSSSTTSQSYKRKFTWIRYEKHQLPGYLGNNYQVDVSTQIKNAWGYSSIYTTSFKLS